MLAVATIFVAGCTSSGSTPSPLVGMWVASAEENDIPKNSSVFLTFREGGAYTMIVRVDGQESRADGNYTATSKRLKFDGKTEYRYKLENNKETLTMRVSNDSSAPSTTYKRVVLELEPAPAN